MSKSNRLEHLDGVRGVAAFIVLISHIFAIYLPNYYFGSTKSAHQLADVFSESLLFVFINGGFAVALFFVLSGYVISMVASRSSESLPMLVGRRYLRLTIPIISSVLFAYVLIYWLQGATSKLYAAEGNGYLLDLYYTRDNYPLYLALWEGLYNCYKFGESYINNVLWSMQIELFGSILIYSIYRLLPSRFLMFFWVISVPLILHFASSKGLYLLGFSFGSILYCSRHRLSKGLPLLATILFIVAGLALGSIPAQPPIDTILAPLIELFDSEQDSFPILTSIGATLILFAILTSRSLKTSFSHPVCVWLGKISFMLYLVHLPVLAIIGSSLYLYLKPDGLSLALFYFSLITLSVLLAWLFTLLVETPTVRLLGYLKAYSVKPSAVLITGGVTITAFISYGNRVGFSVMMAAVILCMGAACFVILNSATQLRMKEPSI